MSVSHLSVRSAASRENLYLLKQTVTNNNFDTFALSELWLDPTVRHADILIPGYTTFRQDRRPHRRGGGVLVYVENIYKDCLIEKWSLVSESNFQQLWLRVLCKKFKSFLICTVYRPPNAPIDFLENLSETFVDSSLHGLNVTILGDLNCNLFGGYPDALSDFFIYFWSIATRENRNKSNWKMQVTYRRCFDNERKYHSCLWCDGSCVAALLTLKANWFDTLTVKQWEIMINSDVILFSATNEVTPYEQLLHYWM